MLSFKNRCCLGSLLHNLTANTPRNQWWQHWFSTFRVYFLPHRCGLRVVIYDVSIPCFCFNYSKWDALCSRHVPNHVNPALRGFLMWFSGQLLIRAVNKWQRKSPEQAGKKIKHVCLPLNLRDCELMSWWLCLRLLVMLWCPKGPPSVTVQAQWASIALAQNPPGNINIPQKFLQQAWAQMPTITLCYQ